MFSDCLERRPNSRNGMKGKCGHGFDMALDYNSGERETQRCMETKTLKGKRCRNVEVEGDIQEEGCTELK